MTQRVPPDIIQPIRCDRWAKPGGRLRNSMAGDPRSTRRYRRLRQAFLNNAAARNTPCARPGCTLGPIRFDLGNNHPLSFNLGHKIEIDRNTADPYDPNLYQAEHAACNAAAGARYRNQKHKPPPNSRQW